MYIETIKEIWNNEQTKNGLALSSALIIAFYLVKFTYQAIQGIRLYFLSQYCCKTDYLRKYGKWAVISGATDGIGLAMAHELAKRGHSIVVIGRNDIKLAATKESLEMVPHVGEVITIKIDLSNSSPENFEAIKDQLDPANRDVGILINNAGIFPGELKRFHRFSLDSLENIVNVNVLATVYLTNMILPGMIKRGRGLILNVSSILGSSPGQCLSVYTPTKSFIDSFSRQLQIEYYSHPIDIINLTPGAVHTKLFINFASRFTKPGLHNPSPQYYAKTALNAVSTRISSISGTLPHGITMYLSKLVDYPTWFYAVTGRALIKLSGINGDFSPIMKRKNRN